MGFSIEPLSCGPCLSRHTHTHTHRTSEKARTQAQTHPSDDLSNHSVPVAASIYASIAAVLHQLDCVPEADHLWELGQHIHAEPFQLRTAGHGVRLLLDFMVIVLDKKDSCHQYIIGRPWIYQDVEAWARVKHLVRGNLRSICPELSSLWPTTSGSS